MAKQAAWLKTVNPTLCGIDTLMKLHIVEAAKDGAPSPFIPLTSNSPICKARFI
jgi:hypothetical protein